MVGVASEWNDYPATSRLHYSLLFAAHRHIWIFSGFNPSPSTTRASVSSFGYLRFKSHVPAATIISRPLLWAWVPVGLVLAYRLATFQLGRDRSVLESMTNGEARYEHFLGPLNLQPQSELHTWIFDRFVLTGPALFLIAHTSGVWLRHHFSGNPPSSGRQY